MAHSLGRVESDLEVVGVQVDAAVLGSRFTSEREHIVDIDCSR